MSLSSHFHAVVPFSSPFSLSTSFTLTPFIHSFYALWPPNIMKGHDPSQLLHEYPPSNLYFIRECDTAEFTSCELEYSKTFQPTFSLDSSRSSGSPDDGSGVNGPGLVGNPYPFSRAAVAPLQPTFGNPTPSLSSCEEDDDDCSLEHNPSPPEHLLSSAVPSIEPSQFTGTGLQVSTSPNTSVHRSSPSIEGSGSSSLSHQGPLPRHSSADYATDIHDRHEGCGDRAITIHNDAEQVCMSNNDIVIAPIGPSDPLSNISPRVHYAPSSPSARPQGHAIVHGVSTQRPIYASLSNSKYDVSHHNHSPWHRYSSTYFRHISATQTYPFPPRWSPVSFRGATDSGAQYPLGVLAQRRAITQSILSAGASEILSLQCSPGHRICPPVEPGHILGVRRAIRTQQHVIYNVPFYGIENVKTSPTRHSLIMESHTSVGAGTGEHQALGSSADFLSRHREHIWAVAHEDEYGSGSSTGRDGCVDHDPSQGRYKRLQRWVAISPARAPNSTKGSSYDRVSIPGTSSRDPLVSIDRAPSRTSGKTSDARANVRDDRLLRPQRLVSEGVYGPDSFTESLEHPKRIEALLKGRRRRFKAMVHKHWRNCLCVLLFLAVTIVVPVLLLSKKAGHLGATGSVNNGILDGGAEMQPSHSIGEGHAVTRTGAVTNQPTAALAPNARITSTPTSFTSTGATKSSSKPAAQTTQIQTQTQTQTWMQTLAPTQTQPEVQQQGQTQSPQNATLP